MAGIVTALIRGKGKKSRVNVFLDEEFAFSLEEITAANLHLGQELADEDAEALQQQDAVNRAQERALSLLERRPRSRTELAQRLHRIGLPPEAVEEALARLQRVGLVDDEAFASYWVEQRLAFRPRSKLALRFELRRQGVSKEIIGRVLRDVDDAEVASRLVRQQLAKLKGTDPQKWLASLNTFLRSRGFGYRTIQDVLASLNLAKDDLEVFDINTGDE
ncbi:MAG: regulatory protein RecX [Anaerolineae bacterium]